MKFLYNRNAIINYLVWLISLAPAYILKYTASPTENAKNYALVEGAFYLFLGIILTFGVQELIERNDTIQNEKLWRKTLRILSYFLLASIVYNIFMFPFATQVSKIMKPEAMGKYTAIATNVVNIFIWISWYIVYIVFQLIEKLNLSRIKSAELASNLRDSQLNALKGQINPHFMFNSLNNIRGLMLEDVERSRDSITRLSEMLRYSLIKSTENAISLEEELEMIQNFVEISKIQFEDRLTYVEDIDSKYYNKSIPPMVIQMLVENATKHGISELKKGGTVHVSAGEENDKFYIRVRNTGKLAFAQNSTKLGLQNIEKRLELLYGPSASFSLNEVDGDVLAEIKIP